MRLFNEKSLGWWAHACIKNLKLQYSHCSLGMGMCACACNHKHAHNTIAAINQKFLVSSRVNNKFSMLGDNMGANGMGFCCIKIQLGGQADIFVYLNRGVAGGWVQ